MLSEEETKELKQKVIEQIESTFPAEKIGLARQQIESMNSEEFEVFLEKNNISVNETEKNSECVFCSIAAGKIKSVKLEENDYALAVLDINPISKGHVLIISKEHEGNDIQMISLAKKVSELIKKKLKPKDVKISTSKLAGHSLVNVLPVYSNENFDSERKNVSLEDLEKVREEIERKPIKKERKQRIKEIKEKLWLPKRIP